MLVKYSAANLARMRKGLAVKVQYLVKVLERVYCLVAPEKIEYIVVVKGAAVLLEPLTVKGLPTLQPKIVVR